MNGIQSCTLNHIKRLLILQWVLLKFYGQSYLAKADPCLLSCCRNMHHILTNRIKVCRQQGSDTGMFYCLLLFVSFNYIWLYIYKFTLFHVCLFSAMFTVSRANCFVNNRLLRPWFRSFRFSVYCRWGCQFNVDGINLVSWTSQSKALVLTGRSSIFMFGCIVDWRMLVLETHYDVWLLFQIILGKRNRRKFCLLLLASIARNKVEQSA